MLRIFLVFGSLVQICNCDTNGILQKNLDELASDANNEDERLTAGFAPFYQPAARSYLGELGRKVSKLFGVSESSNYYEKPLDPERGYTRFQRHKENLNNELTFRDIVEGNQASVRKDVSSPDSDMNTYFQEKRSSDNDDYNEVDDDDDDDSWLMNSMASDQPIADDSQPSNIYSDAEDYSSLPEQILENNYGVESVCNNGNNGYHDRRMRQIRQNEKSDDLLVNPLEIAEGSQSGNTITGEESESTLQKLGNLKETLYLEPKSQQKKLSIVENTSEASLTPQGHSDDSSYTGTNYKKREVNVSEDDDNNNDDEDKNNLNIIDSDNLKSNDNRLEQSEISEEGHDSSQNISYKNSQELATPSNILSTNDEASNENFFLGENQISELTPAYKHKRTFTNKFKKKMSPFKMENSLNEQMPSFDSGGGILLKDLDFQNEYMQGTDEKDSKTLSSQSPSTSMSDIENKDRKLVLKEQVPTLSMHDASNKSSVETEADVSSVNSEYEIKLSQSSVGESIMESEDGVKTLRLSSMNFKGDNESNFSSDQSNVDKYAIKKQKSHYASTRNPVKLRHKNKHSKLNSTKGTAVSSYNRHGFLRTSTAVPAHSKVGDGLNSKWVIHENDKPSKSIQSSNSTRKKSNVTKKGDSKHKSDTASKKMVKVKLGVSPCQFNKNKYSINNTAASKANISKILSSRSVKQERLNGTRMLKEKLNLTNSSDVDHSKMRRPANDLENKNFFDKTTHSSFSTLQKISDKGQKGSHYNKADKKEEKLKMKPTTLATVPTSTTKKLGFFSMKSHRKHSKSAHITGKKHNSPSLNEDDACGEEDNNDDDEYSDGCEIEKTTKSVCKTTEECSTEEASCDPLENDDDDDDDDDTDNDETDAPCETTENESPTTEPPCPTTCETTEDPCSTTEAPCSTPEPPCPTTCDTTEAPCSTTEAPCPTTEAPCPTPEPPCPTTCETTEAPKQTPEPPFPTTCETTEAPKPTPEPPCETTEAPKPTPELPCPTTCETTEAPKPTPETPCETTEAPKPTPEPPFPTTCEITEAPKPTPETPCETTEAPKPTPEPCPTTCGETTEASKSTLEPRCPTPEPPCPPTEAPCPTTEAPCPTTEPSCPTTCETTEAAGPTTCETTEAPSEEMETDPPCTTTKICKTASKKGNSSSDLNNEYIDNNDDEDNDEYDYETE